MDKESIKQKLIAELNDNGMLLYAERQKFKLGNLPKELMEKMRIKYKKQKILSVIAFVILGIFIILSLTINKIWGSPQDILQNVGIQFTPILGVLFFSAQNQNLGKKIFILELLLNWEE